MIMQSMSMSRTMHMIDRSFTERSSIFSLFYFYLMQCFMYLYLFAFRRTYKSRCLPILVVHYAARLCPLKYNFLTISLSTTCLVAPFPKPLGFYSSTPCCSISHIPFLPIPCTHHDHHHFYHLTISFYTVH